MRRYTQRFTPNKFSVTPEIWAERGARIQQLYDELVPIMTDIHATQISSKTLLGDTKVSVEKVSDTDGFMRLIDLMPNVNQVLILMSDSPSEYDHPPDYLKKLAARLCTNYAPQTPAIFREVKTMLRQYGGDRDALRIADDLEWALNETYAAAEALRGKVHQR